MTTATLAVVQSKPELQKALRDTWRRSSTHLVEQLQRFLRLAFLAAAPSFIDLVNGGNFDRKTLIAFAVPVLEVAYRQMFPALGAKGADDAYGVTIVPEQVGADAYVPPEPPGPPPFTGGDNPVDGAADPEDDSALADAQPVDDAVDQPLVVNDVEGVMPISMLASPAPAKRAAPKKVTPLTELKKAPAKRPARKAPPA